MFLRLRVDCLLPLHVYVCSVYVVTGSYPRLRFALLFTFTRYGCCAFTFVAFTLHTFGADVITLCCGVVGVIRWLLPFGSFTPLVGCYDVYVAVPRLRSRTYVVTRVTFYVRTRVAVTLRLRDGLPLLHVYRCLLRFPLITRFRVCP